MKSCIKPVSGLRRIKLANLAKIQVRIQKRHMDKAISLQFERRKSRDRVKPCVNPLASMCCTCMYKMQ